MDQSQPQSTLRLVRDDEQPNAHHWLPIKENALAFVCPCGVIKVGPMHSADDGKTWANSEPLCGIPAEHMPSMIELVKQLVA